MSLTGSSGDIGGGIGDRRGGEDEGGTAEDEAELRDEIAARNGRSKGRRHGTRGGVCEGDYLPGIRGRADQCLDTN
jgi:hypothetical protein